jgi:hypothetical protein
MNITSLATSAGRAVSAEASLVSRTLSAFGVRGWLIAFLAGVGTLFAIGTVSAIFANPYFTRMTPVRAQDFPIWIATGVLVGLIAGTFATRSVGGHTGKVLAGGLFADLAVGCPVCNKVVVLLLGTSGALTFFEPLQLWIGLGSLGLLAWTLLLRARAITAPCPVGA